MITQRMVGLENMDEILILQDGCVVERGNHDQLLSSGIIYRRMWDLYHQIL
jgi:ABC-type multidrug transport system fused ATPase/permease subunit